MSRGLLAYIDIIIAFDLLFIIPISYSFSLLFQFPPHSAYIPSSICFFILLRFLIVTIHSAHSASSPPVQIRWDSLLLLLLLVLIPKSLPKLALRYLHRSTSHLYFDLTRSAVSTTDFLTLGGDRSETRTSNTKRPPLGLGR